jgi:hypothetical protein
MIALPVLNSALPASARAAAASTAAPKRLAWVYVPNGANMVDWTPTTTGTGYELPRILEPLAAHKKNLSVLTGMANPMGDELGDGGGATPVPRPASSPASTRARPPAPTSRPAFPATRSPPTRSATRPASAPSS